MQRLKKGDNVQVLLGKDRGKSGTIDRILKAKGKVAITGINMYKRHVKKQGDIEGGVIEIVKPINMSNVMLVCPSCKKATRVSIKSEGDTKIRVCKKCQKEIR